MVTKRGKVVRTEGITLLEGDTALQVHLEDGNNWSGS